MYLKDMQQLTGGVLSDIDVSTMFLTFLSDLVNDSYVQLTCTSDGNPVL